METTAQQARSTAGPALVVAIGAATSAVVLAATHGTGVSSVLLWAVLPDLSFLAAIGQRAAPKQLPRRAVPLYNLLHRPLLPLGLIAGAIVGIAGVYWLVAGLSWLAHIHFDRASGYGLRSPDGWQRG